MGSGPDAITLEGQVALVTGAGRGIGRTMATHLAERGAAIVAVARSAAEIDEVVDGIRGDGGRAERVAGDARDSEVLVSAAAVARTAFGPLDLAVHCAGTADVIGPLWETDLATWWDEVTVHVKGAANLAHAVLPDMVTRGSGRIVTVYGNLGDSGGGHCSAYACGKAAVLRLTEQLDAEAGPHGVRTFAIHPGLVETSMTRQLATGEAGRRWFPRFSEVPDDRWEPPGRAAALVGAVAAGRVDHLSGRLVGAWEDLGETAASVGEAERALRVVPPGHDIVRVRSDGPR